VLIGVYKNYIQEINHFRLAMVSIHGTNRQGRWCFKRGSVTRFVSEALVTI